MIDFLSSSYGAWDSTFMTWQFIRNWNLFRQSRRATALEAAQAMATLNHFTKGALNFVEERIYHLKRKMTHYLYHHYPTDVQMLHQTLKCRSCDGTGTYVRRSWDGDILWEDWCWHCGASGVYKEVDIMVFSFHIDGECVSWHQPRGLCDFNVYIPKLVGIYEGEKQAHYSRAGETDFVLAYLTVHEFLWRVGIANARLTLLRALRVDLSRLRHQLPHILHHKWDDFLDWLIGDQGSYPPEWYWQVVEEDDFEDGVPF